MQISKGLKVAVTLSTFLFMASCKTSAPKIQAHMPDGLQVHLQGDSASQIKINKAKLITKHGYKTVYISYTNLENNDQGVVYRIDWLDKDGMPSGDTEGLIFSKAGSNQNITVGSPYGEAVKADVNISLSDLNRKSLRLTQIDYKRMITAVVAKMQIGMDLTNKKAVVAIRRVENNTDDSSIKIKDMKTFLTEALQASGHFDIRSKGTADRDVQVWLDIIMQGSRDNDNQGSMYTVILNMNKVNGGERKYNSIIKFKKAEE